MSVNGKNPKVPKLQFQAYTTFGGREAGLLTPENTTDTVKIEPHKDDQFGIAWATTCSLSSLINILKADYGYELEADPEDVADFESFLSGGFYSFRRHAGLEGETQFTYDTSGGVHSPGKSEIAVGTRRPEIEVVSDLFDQTATKALRRSKRVIFDKVEELTLKS